MVARLAEKAGGDVPERLASAFLARLENADPVAAASRLQREEPALFEVARTFLAPLGPGPEPGLAGRPLPRREIFREGSDRN